MIGDRMKVVDNLVCSTGMKINSYTHGEIGTIVDEYEDSCTLLLDNPLYEIPYQYFKKELRLA